MDFSVETKLKHLAMMLYMHRYETSISDYIARMSQMPQNRQKLSYN